MADVALDDYIKTSNFKSSGWGRGRGRGRGRGIGVRGRGGGMRGRGAFSTTKRLQDARGLLNSKINQRMRLSDARQRISQNKKSSIMDARQLLVGRGAGPGVRGRGGVVSGPVVLPRVSVRNDQYRAPPPPRLPPPVIVKQPVVRVRQLKQLTGPQHGMRSDIHRNLLQRTIPNRVPRRDARVDMMEIDVENDDYRDRSPLTDEEIEMERIAAAAAVAKRREARLMAAQSHRLSPRPRGSEAAPSATGGYRVEVTNLHHGVTKEDIFELFTSIGPLRRCTMPRPGRAEVIFSKKEDAMAAMRRYDKRELDGQAMHLRLMETARGLVTSSSGVRATNGSSFRRSGRQMEPDMDTVRSALFRRSRVGPDFQVSI